METKVPRLSRFSSLVKNVLKSPLGVLRKDDDSSKTETEEPKIRYENTYRMGPDEAILSSHLQGIMKSAISEMVAGENEDFLEYDGRGYICTRLSDDIKQRVKTEFYNGRYRIIVHVSIVQRTATLSVGSRCLWNDKTDTYASVSVNFADSAIIATCYMLYFE